jgi:hypothetical protein
MNLINMPLNPHVVHSMDCKPHGTYEPLLLDDFYRSVAQAEPEFMGLLLRVVVGCHIDAGNTWASCV